MTKSTYKKYIDFYCKEFHNKYIDVHSKEFYSLGEIYGEEFLQKYNKLTTKQSEDICHSIFKDVDKPRPHNKSRGDFYITNKDGEEIYFDQKDGEINKQSPYGWWDRTMFNVKYSNLISKYWVDIIFDELKLIINDFTKTYGEKHENLHVFFLEKIRDEREITANQMNYINNYIILDKNSTSFCGKNNINFFQFANLLCGYNVRRFANLMVFHEPKNYEQKIMTKKDGLKYRAYYYEKQKYVVTPVYIKTAAIILDYIGLGGFKCFIDNYNKKYDKDKIIEVPDIMLPYFYKIDKSIFLKMKSIEFNDNNRCRVLCKMEKDSSENFYEYMEKNNIDINKEIEKETLTDVYYNFIPIDEWRKN